MHCLTSGLFRKEFYSIFICCSWNNNRRVGVLTQMLGKTTQTGIGLTHLRKQQNRQDCSIETMH